MRSNKFVHLQVFVGIAHFSIAVLSEFLLSREFKRKFFILYSNDYFERILVEIIIFVI